MNVPQWEYLMVVIDSEEKRRGDRLTDMQRQLNDYGDRGWELTGDVSYGVATFKRVKGVV